MADVHRRLLTRFATLLRSAEMGWDLLRGAGLGLVLLACHRTPPIHEPAASAERPRVSTSCAEALLAHAAAPSREARDRLLSHPALVAVVRHQQMSGKANADPGEVLDRLAGAIRDPEGAAKVLDTWRGREAELLEAADASAALLPAGVRFSGEVHFVVGYDIAVASPPDVLVNADHPHFVADPEDVAFYVVHEAHHVGFLAARPMPEISRLDDPVRLRALIRFMTQMEGMAVHAAFAPRRDASALTADEDYEVYLDAGFVQDVVDRYREVWGRVDDSRALTGQEIGEILGAMSSGERLWYRFGAVVADRVERRLGRGTLIRSIAEPGLFWAEAEGLLSEG